MSPPVYSPFVLAKSPFVMMDWDKGHRSKVTGQTFDCESANRHMDTQTRPILLPRPLKREVITQVNVISKLVSKMGNGFPKGITESPGNFSNIMSSCYHK